MDRSDNRNKINYFHTIPYHYALPKRNIERVQEPRVIRNVDPIGAPLRLLYRVGKEYKNTGELGYTEPKRPYTEKELQKFSKTAQYINYKI